MENRKKTRIIIITTIGMIIGALLIIAGILIFWNEDFKDLLVKLISLIKQKSPDLLVEGQPVYKIWLENLIPYGRWSVFAGTAIFLFFLIFFIDSRSKELKFFDRLDKQLLFETRIFSLFVAIMSGIMMALIITLGLVSWPVVDSLSLYTRISSSGVLGNAWNMYAGWDGRFFVFLLHVPLFQIFKSGYTYFVVAFNACCLILTAYVSSMFLTKITGNKKLIYYDFSLMLGVLWLGLVPIISSVVYWAVGGLYIFTSLFIFLWILIIYLLLFRVKSIGFKYFTVPLLMIFSFLIGGAGQPTSPALIFLTIVMLILARRKERNSKMVVSAALIFLILGTIFMLFAPGNFARAEFGAGSFNFSVISIFKNYINTFMGFSKGAISMIGLAIIGAFCSAIVKIKTSETKNITFISYIKSNKERLIMIISFLIAALITLIPFVMVPDFASPRASIYYVIFLLLFIWGIIDFFSVLFINGFYKKYCKRIGALMMIPIICFTILSFGVIVLSSKNIYQGIFIRSQMSERNEYLLDLSEAEKKHDITVKPVQGSIPELIHFKDITADKENWVNTAVAEFYGVKSIRLE